MVYRQLLIGALLKIFEEKPPAHPLARTNERKRLDNLPGEKLGEDYKKKTGQDPRDLKPTRAK